MKWLRPTISVTNSCNLSCKYCYLEASPKKKSALTISQIKEIVDLVTLHGAEEIKWTGGEILTYNHLNEAIDYAFNKGIKSTIFTNGTLINKKFLDRNSNMIKSIAISIDGPQDITDFYRGKGTFSKVIKSLVLIEKYNIPITIMATIDKKSLPYISFFEELSNSYKVDLIKIGILLEKGRAESWSNALSEKEALELVEEIEHMYERAHFTQKYGTNLLLGKTLELYNLRILDTLFETLWIDWRGYISVFPPSNNYILDKENSICHYSNLTSEIVDEYYMVTYKKLKKIISNGDKVIELYEALYKGVIENEDSIERV
ncbi:radical SAM protein [Listeria seeligeri]|uniref:radical SAM protein n=1 Tax=Listeria seeligeri TaxID=1640 RepID=UPI0010B71AAA|nr:radical SAM protein [Listeria seeligeri]MBC1581474.1 radical SAM protein [Listeria seeligeri]MBC1584602.1 radical SAM protein [Listeria seeligeri]MBC1595557.1 radical SAM protein [Listeria seeligeri]MBC1598236.1 radical SAM protein [Listeria seeligeri]MBC1932220.1 radical SAM protein [Listeria seeligeri]